MTWWDGWRKHRAIRRYLERCAPALIARYGWEEHYSPARIRATLAALQLSFEFFEYACAMFANERDFVEWSSVSAASDPSRPRLAERYRALRREVAERHTGGISRFLPQRLSDDRMAPLWGSWIGEREGGGFRWYR